MVQCKACGATYEPIGADGVRYFHACPPLTKRRVQRAGVWQDVPLDQVQPSDTVTVVRAGAPVPVLVSAIAKDDVIAGDTTAPRPGARDENVVQVDITKPGVAKADGAGVTKL